MTAACQNIGVDFRAQTFELKSQFDLRKLYAELTGNPVKIGGSTRCFNSAGHKHDDRHPSMQVAESHFKCHACGEKGDAISLVQRIRGCSFREARAYLGDRSPTALRATSRSVLFNGVGKQCAHAVPQINGGATGRGRGPDGDDDALQLREAIWDAVRCLELTPLAVHFLERRGISPVTAHKAGCRDFWPVAREVIDIMRQFPPGARIRCGLSRPERGVLRDWFPLEMVAKGELQYAGLCIPSFFEGERAPNDWRWRLIEPLQRFSSLNRLKSVATYGGTAPFGLALPPGEPRREFGGDSGLLAICEGEVDYLSVLDALGGSCRVIGLPNVAAHWPSEFNEHLRHVSRVVVMLHDGAAAERLAQEIARSLVEVQGVERAKSAYLRACFAERNDANDYHVRGELRPMLLNWLNIEADPGAVSAHASVVEEEQ